MEINHTVWRVQIIFAKKTFYLYLWGVPSKGIVCIVIGMIDKRKFEALFLKWFSSLVNILPEELVVVDGETICSVKTFDEK